MSISEKNTAALTKFVQDHLREDPAQLLLKYHQIADFDLKFAIQQISARQKAKQKLPEWTENPDLLFPVSLSMEQCSSELTARFKARMIGGDSLVDLTGGFGVDTYYLSQQFGEATYLERDEQLTDLARHNFSQLAAGKIKVVHGDALEFLEKGTEKFTWLYVDPARRGQHNQKLYKLADCEPDVVGHWDLLKRSADNILVKASPMLDIKAVLGELPDIQQVWVLSVKNEVKEVLLLWESIKQKDEPSIHCVNLTGEAEEVFLFNYEEENSLNAPLAEVGSFLIEPNASIMKAGGFKAFAIHYGLDKLHLNSHLYSSSSLPEEVPGRVFVIVEEIKADKKSIKKTFPSGQVNVIVRNHPLKAEALKQKFRLKDGGEDYLIATTTKDGKPRLFHCRRK